VARADELDAEFFQARIQAEIRAVDDAENFFHAFIRQHLRDDLAAGGLLHTGFFLKLMNKIRFSLPQKGLPQKACLISPYVPPLKLYSLRSLISRLALQRRYRLETPATLFGHLPQVADKTFA